MPKDNGTLGGKIAKFHRMVTNPGSKLSRLVDLGRLHLIILLYVATDQAERHLKESTRILWEPAQVHWDIEVVQRLSESLKVTPNNCGFLAQVVDRYYDHEIHDEHMQKGGTEDSRYGFAACGLPVVLHHNAPNNSVALLWSYEDKKVKGLFPRIRRHKEAP
jgi:hypothetical protein